MAYVTADQFDIGQISLSTLKRPVGNQGKKNPRMYKSIICAFDIETTRLEKIDQSIMYIWQMQLGPDCTVIGRTWEQLKALLDKLKEGMEHNEYFVVYVHNLSYEFQFLRAIYRFDATEVFCTKSRRILKCEMFGHFEFRCSYFLTNLSLANFCRRMGTEHQKLSGVSFDYSKLRYPWTRMTNKEIQYCVHDVIGLVEAVTIRMEQHGDNLYTIPLTSTGYVRRAAKQAMRGWERKIRAILPDYRTYRLLRSEFRGGDTHANRFLAGQILEDVKSADRSSSYPDVIVNCLFPMTKFEYVEGCDLEKALELIYKRKRAAIMRVRIYGLRLTDQMNPCPYISRAKCEAVADGIYDNGRVLSCSVSEMCLTDIDFGIILDEYEFDTIEILDFAHARYGRLPQPLIDLTNKLYKDKTSLKGVAGEEVFYMIAKEWINALYGMFAQDPVKQEIEFTAIGDKPYAMRAEDEEALLLKSNQKAFLAYQWACWVTSWARLRLREGIRLAGVDFVYCDTDSVKYLGEIDWSEYNAERIAASKENGAFATDPKGNMHYMGVYEMEQGYERFITLGAKKYAYDQGGATYCTVSGVMKHDKVDDDGNVIARGGGSELKAHGGLEAFIPGFVFTEAGGTEAVYNDDPEPKEIKIGRHVLPITPNVCIKESTYSLGVTEEYEELLESSKEVFDKFKQVRYNNKGKTISEKQGVI